MFCNPNISYLDKSRGIFSDSVNKEVSKFIDTANNNIVHDVSKADIDYSSLHTLKQINNIQVLYYFLFEITVLQI